VISHLRREGDGNCAVLGLLPYRRFGTTYLSRLQGSISRNVGNKYNRYSLRNSPEECSYNLKLLLFNINP